MGVREVVIDTDHAVVFGCVSLVRCDQVPGSVTVIGSIRRREEVEELLHTRIDSDGNTLVRRSVTAGRWVAACRQQTFMGKRVRHRCDCRGCLYFPKSLIAHVEEGMATNQRPADSSSELVANKRGNWSTPDIEVVFGIERGISMEFKQRTMEVIASGLGRHLDDAASISTVFRVKGLCEDAYLARFIHSEKEPGRACWRIAENGIIGIHAVDEDIRPAGTHTIDRHLSALASR